jgi:hypothetical protein
VAGAGPGLSFADFCAGGVSAAFDFLVVLPKASVKVHRSAYIGGATGANQEINKRHRIVYMLDKKRSWFCFVSFFGFEN